MILLIDTALSTACVGLSRNGKLLASRVNTNQKEHASFIHPAIAGLMEETGTGWDGISAVAVSNGPGSYTGLRVGLATAKGICFAKNLPLICLNTLHLIAGAWLRGNTHEKKSASFIIPMIDARRMEVFTAVYNSVLNIVSPPSALILTPESYLEYLSQGPVAFIGDGSAKWAGICMHPNAQFPENPHETADFMAEAANSAFEMQEFNDLAYAEPFYIKDFHATTPVVR